MCSKEPKSIAIVTVAFAGNSAECLPRCEPHYFFIFNQLIESRKCIAKESFNNYNYNSEL